MSLSLAALPAPPLLRFLCAFPMLITCSCASNGFPLKKPTLFGKSNLFGDNFTMNRLLHASLLLSICLVVLWNSSAKAETLDAKTMKVALHTATPQEDGFIDRVVEMMEKGKLPRALVESTFLWARKKTRNKFYYFQYGLIRRAAEIGITIQ